MCVLFLFNHLYKGTHIMRKLAQKLARAIMFSNPSTVEEIRRSIIQSRGMEEYRRVERLARELAGV